MTLTMNGDLVFGRITGEGTGGSGNVMGIYPGTGPVDLVADFGDGKQYSTASSTDAIASSARAPTTSGRRFTAST